MTGKKNTKKTTVEGEDTQDVLPRGASPLTFVKVNDDPLNTENTSKWAKFHKDLELHEEIWKDVARTHPGLAFFHGKTYEEMERVLFVYAKLNRGSATFRE